MARAVSFFLPQFHPIPENNQWWGAGFTEWTNVSKCRPRFTGHYQPHIPSDLGFYDLRLPEVREQQVEYATNAGIEGFCYYHYWFNGRRILERPVNDMLKTGRPNAPFCLCWANENWSRRWDGSDNQLLLEQNHNEADDLAHIQYLMEVFGDSRYIRVNGKPLFLVYRTGLLPDPKKTTDLWRNEAIKCGLGELYLVRVETFGDNTKPESIGFDAAVEFPPHSTNTKRLRFHSKYSRYVKGHVPSKLFYDNSFFDYSQVVHSYVSRGMPDYKLIRCATPSWDNFARKKKGALVYLDSTPEKYGYWLSRIVQQTDSAVSTESEKLVFINAWNEWAEGNHLEPDLKWGNQYLVQTKKALSRPDSFDSYRLDLSPKWKYQPLDKIYYELDRRFLWRLK